MKTLLRLKKSIWMRTRGFFLCFAQIISFIFECACTFIQSWLRWMIFCIRSYGMTQIMRFLWKGLTSCNRRLTLPCHGWRNRMQMFERYEKYSKSRTFVFHEPIKNVWNRFGVSSPLLVENDSFGFLNYECYFSICGFVLWNEFLITQDWLGGVEFGLNPSDLNQNYMIKGYKWRHSSSVLESVFEWTVN